MKNTPIITLLTSCVSICATQAATNFVNIDLQGGGNVINTTGLAVAPDTQGASAAWNIYNQSVSAGALNYSDGTASGMTVTLAGTFGSWAHQNGGDSTSNIGTNGLLKDYVYDNAGGGNDINFTLGSVAAGVYDLYVYGDLPFITVGNSQTTTVNVTGETSQNIVWAGGTDAGTFQVGENYVLFEDITLAAAGSITGSVTAATGEANLSGFQLVAAVPEPSTSLLTALSALALIGRRRRK